MRHDHVSNAGHCLLSDHEFLGHSVVKGPGNELRIANVKDEVVAPIFA